MKKLIQSILYFFKKSKKDYTQIVEQLDTGLENTISTTYDYFEKDNHAFLINLANNNNIVFQIIHGVLISLSLGENINEVEDSKKQFNFSLNLIFENEEELKKFKKLTIFNKFKYYEIQDGITCFTINFGKDKELTKQTSLDILQSVYGYQLTDTFEFEIYDQGKF